MDRVAIFDTTLRDGELTDGVSFTTDDKIAIASQLAAIGVDVIEVAVAGASLRQLDDVRAIAAEVRTGTLCVLAPARADAIDAAGEALRGAASARIHVFQPAGGGDDAAVRAESMVRRARGLAHEVEFTPANGARADLDAVVSIARAALRGGATVLNLADTVGAALPEDVAARVRDLRAALPELGSCRLSFHGHDDLGLATANSLAAMRAGARQIEVAVNGLGARAGNAPLEEVVTLLVERGAALGLSTRIAMDGLLALSRLVAERSGVAVAAQKAIVGRSARLASRSVEAVLGTPKD